jgi:hypothetical protein
MDTNRSAQMQAFWIIQRNVDSMRERLKRHWLGGERRSLKEALKVEERKLAAMAEQPESRPG